MSDSDGIKSPQRHRAECTDPDCFTCQPHEQEVSRFRETREGDNVHGRDDLTDDLEPGPTWKAMAERLAWRGFDEEETKRILVLAESLGRQMEWLSNQSLLTAAIASFQRVERAVEHVPEHAEERAVRVCRTRHKRGCRCAWNGIDA